MPLTKQQEAAVQNIEAWYNETNVVAAPTFTLIGAAGCGKSFTISYILRRLQGKKVALSPTNKAKKVLENFFAEQNVAIEVKTLHSALGYLVAESRGKYKVKGKRVISDSVSSVKAVNDSSIKKDVDLIVVDEASMVDVGIETELVNLAKAIGARILWVGDNYQLKPPGKVQCTAFKNPNRSILSEVVRYSGGSLRIATELRSIIKDNRQKPSLEQLVSYQNELDQELHNVFLLDRKEWFKRLKASVVSEDDFTVLAFKNDTVVDHNSVIRDFRGRTRDLELEDRLIALKPVKIDTYKRNKHVPQKYNKFHNGETVRVINNVAYTVSIPDCFSEFTYEDMEDLTIEPDKFVELLWGETKTEFIHKPCRSIFLSSEEESRRNNVELVFLDPDNLSGSVELINEVQDRIAKIELFSNIMYGLGTYNDKIVKGEEFAADKCLERYNVVVREGIKDLHTYLQAEYGDKTSKRIQQASTKIKRIYSILMEWKSLQFLTYHWNYADAITVHKSQGSTFNNVFIDGCDIMKAPQWKSLMYVALTRAEGNVYILN